MYDMPVLIKAITSGVAKVKITGANNSPNLKTIPPSLLEKPTIKFHITEIVNDIVVQNI